MIRIFFGDAASGGGGPEEPSVPDQPYIQATWPRRRAHLSVAILAAACAFVPLSAGPATAQGGAQGGAGVLRRPRSIQYQAVTAPVAVADALTRNQVPWWPTYPSQIHRPRVHASRQQAVANRIESAAAQAFSNLSWLFQTPDPVRRAGAHTSRQTHVVAPVGVGFGYVSWSYPDSIDPKRAIGRAQQATRYTTTPLHVPDVTQVAPRLSWAPRYPDAIRRPRAHASALRVLSAPVAVPDVEDAVTPLAWEPQYPHHVLVSLPRLATGAQQAFAWHSQTPEADLGQAINQWAIYPDQVYGKTHPLSGRQFELVAPIFVSDVTEGVVSLGWLPTAPDYIAALRARPHLYQAFDWPSEVVPDLAVVIYPDRVPGVARVVQFQDYAAPLFVPDVTDPAPPFDGWQGSAEMPIWRVRRVTGQGWVFSDAGIEPEAIGAVGPDFFIVSAQGRWFRVSAQDRWFLVKGR